MCSDEPGTVEQLSLKKASEGKTIPMSEYHILHRRYAYTLYISSTMLRLCGCRALLAIYLSTTHPRILEALDQFETFQSESVYV